MDRRNVLEILHQIAFSNPEEADKVQEYIDRVIDSDEVPQDVFHFLFSLSDYAKDFFMRMENKTFYKNFKKFEEIDNIEKAKSISSYITHALIEIEHGNSETEKLKEDLMLNDFLNFLKYYLEKEEISDFCIKLVGIITEEIDKIQEVSGLVGGDGE